MAQVRARAVKGSEGIEADWPTIIALPRASVEVALYAMLVMVAGAMRLYALGREPLGGEEAAAAWAVWRFYLGQAGAGVTHAPLLFFGNVLTFVIFEAGDAAARLVPAILGTALVALPCFLRRWLGRWGALAAAAMLAVSPSLVFFSRSLSSTVPAVTTAVAFVAALLGYLSTREQRYLYAVAVTLALALASGPAVYTVLAAMATFGLIAALVERLGRPAGGHLTTNDGLLSIACWSENRSLLVRCLGLFGGTFALVSTGFLADYRGIQASLDIFGGWVRGFVPGGSLGSWYVLQVLLSYEVLPLVFGVIGGAYFSVRRSPLATFLTIWFGLALLVRFVAGARDTGDVVIVLVPLILLAGMSVGRLLDTLTRHATLETEGFLTVLALAVTGFLYLQLSGYALRGPAGFVRLSVGAVAVLLGLVAYFVYWSGREPALRGAGLAALLVTGALFFRASFNLNLAWSVEPVELLRPRSTASDVRQLVRFLEGLSNDREGVRYSIGITADQSLAPILPWYVRRFERVRFVDSGRHQPDTPVVIVPVEVNPPLSESFIGQRFRLETSWRLSATTWRDRWRWYLFRLAPAEPLARDIVLYTGR